MLQELEIERIVKSLRKQAKLRKQASMTSISINIREIAHEIIIIIKIILEPATEMVELGVESEE